MRRRRPHAPVVLAAASVLVVSGCSTETSPESAPGTTVPLMADYPAYDATSLPSAAAIVVEGTTVATEPTVLTPVIEEGTPEEDPRLGLSAEQVREAVDEDDAVPATAVTLRVHVVHKGGVEADDEITVVQTGGVVDGTTYEAPGETLLAEGESYLLFAEDSPDGTYVTVGGSAGIYRATESGTFVATDPQMAPFGALTSSQVADVVGEP